jgi:hypothetical protein
MGVGQDQSDPMDMLIGETGAALRAAGEDRAAIITAIRRFLDAGMAIVYSPSAMWDFFGMVLHRARFNKHEKDRRNRIFSTVTNEVFQGGRPYPPDWPWHEREIRKPAERFPMIDRRQAISIAHKLAPARASEPFDEQDIDARTNDGGLTWTVRLSSETPEDIVVDGRTGQAKWARMTADEWMHSTNPREMLRAARRRVNPVLMWRFVCALGRRLWDQLEYEAWRIAIATAERWLEGQADDDDLNNAWFDATAGGASLGEGWATADEMLQVYGEPVIAPREVCDMIRQVFGNPFAADRGQTGPERA